MTEYLTENQREQYQPDDLKYDLYAVTQHIPEKDAFGQATGQLERGHYTTYVLNDVDGKWYHYDDFPQKITPMPEAEDGGSSLIGTRNNENMIKRELINEKFYSLRQTQNI